MSHCHSHCTIANFEMAIVDGSQLMYFGLHGLRKAVNNNQLFSGFMSAGKVRGQPSQSQPTSDFDKHGTKPLHQSFAQKEKVKKKGGG